VYNGAVRATKNCYSDNQCDEARKLGISLFVLEDKLACAACSTSTLEERETLQGHPKGNIYVHDLHMRMLEISWKILAL
jgi:hypothetical protein